MKVINSFVFSLFFFVVMCHGDEIFVLNGTEFYHYEYIDVLGHVSKESNYRMQVLKDGVIFPDIIGREKICPVVEVKKGKTNIRFIFIPPYGVQDGQYELRIYKDDDITFSTNIYFISRVQARLEEPIIALNFEENYNILNLVRDFNRLGIPVEGKSDYDKVGSGIKYLLNTLKCNTFIMLGGQTTWLVSKEEVWLRRTLNNTKILRYLKREGFQTGAYVMAFLTLGVTKDGILGYKPNLVLKNGKIQKDLKYTSITSYRRVEDIKDILVELGKKDYIDFIGLDFLRVGDYGGYELSKDFFCDILIKMPEYSSLVGEFRRWDMNDLVRFSKIVRTNVNVGTMFKWYQSRRVSLIIKEIKDYLRENGVNKPLIAFMLGWNGGREHGQDLFMFRDAGIDYAFYMLYEMYSEKMFNEMGMYYLSKIYNKDSNIVFGNIIDAKLNDGVNPLKTFSRRLREFMMNYSYFTPNGLFFHDLHRLLRGRLGQFSTYDWMDEIRGLRESL